MPLLKGAQAEHVQRAEAEISEHRAVLSIKSWAQILRKCLDYVQDKDSIYGQGFPFLFDHRKIECEDKTIQIV